MSNRLVTEAMLLRIHNIFVEIEQAIAAKKKFSLTKIQNSHKFFGGAFMYAAKKLGILDRSGSNNGGGPSYHFTDRYKELYPTEASRQNELPVHMLKLMRRYNARIQAHKKHGKKRFKARTRKPHFDLLAQAALKKTAPILKEWPVSPGEETEQIVLDLFENDILILILKGVVRGSTPPGLVAMAKDMLEKLEAL